MEDNDVFIRENAKPLATEISPIDDVVKSIESFPPSQLKSKLTPVRGTVADIQEEYNQKSKFVIHSLN